VTILLSETKQRNALPCEPVFYTPISNNHRLKSEYFVLIKK